MSRSNDTTKQWKGDELEPILGPSQMELYFAIFLPNIVNGKSYDW